MTTSPRSPSLANGAPLSASTWHDFVNRLREAHLGETSLVHAKSNPMFRVDRLVNEIVDHETMVHMIRPGEGIVYSVQRFLSTIPVAEAEILKELGFEILTKAQKQQVLKNLGYNHQVVSVAPYWSAMNWHLTAEAAEAFVDAFKDKFLDLRVMVEHGSICWELATIKNAILNGQLQFVEPKPLLDTSTHLQLSKI